MSDEESKFQCPCCDYYTLDKRHVYSICPVCYWEDEFDITIEDLDVESDANHKTLREARTNFEQIGVSDPSRLDDALDPKSRAMYEYQPRDIS